MPVTKPKKTDPAAETPPTFEQAQAELESLVDAMEQGELSLEEALRAYERGVALVRLCQQSLDAVEQKVEILSGKSADAPLEPFPDVDGRA